MLAQTLNFTRAAEQCNVTQPALTKALQKLEHEFGGNLVHRERRLTQLTDLGKLVLPMLERTVDAADSARRQANRFRAKEVASICIGLPPSVSALLIVGALSNLAGCIEGLQVHVIEGHDRELTDALLEGRIHAALMVGSDEWPRRLDHWPLFEESYVVAVAPSHPFARLEVVPIGALEQTVWLERDGCAEHSVLMRLCFDANARLKIAHRGRLEDHLQHMTAAGLGAMLIPGHMPRLANVISRPIDGDPVRRCVGLATVAGRRHSPALNAFIKIARKHNWQDAVRRLTALSIHSQERREQGKSQNDDAQTQPVARKGSLVQSAPVHRNSLH
jgi:DNA-binding transcriptional LysR family regulator